MPAHVRAGLLVGLAWLRNQILDRGEHRDLPRSFAAMSAVGELSLLCVYACDAYNGSNERGGPPILPGAPPTGK
ncbi:hypothetical protein KRMM14A1004_63320 [Krasilnikovia sp. MM14-A1004]